MIAFPPPSVASDENLKPVMKGAVDRGGTPASRTPIPGELYRPVVNNYVTAVSWAELQPQAEGEIVANNRIDQDLAAIRSLNAADPALNMHLKLRVFAGRWAPGWAKELGGSPLTVYDGFDGSAGTIGRFWSPAFGAAYADLQAKLAARYDDVPEILMTEISRCSLFYPEPFVRSVSSADPAKAPLMAQNVATLLAADYSDAADRQCHREEVEAHDVWQRTRTGLAFNPYPVIDGSGAVSTDVAFTETMMEHCRQVLGERCVLQNFSIRTPITDLGPRYAPMYEHMRELGAPLLFQTAVESRAGDWQTTIGWAVEQGANAVELVRTYATGTATGPPYALETLRELDDRLEANPEGSSSPATPESPVTPPSTGWDPLAPATPPSRTITTLLATPQQSRVGEGVRFTAIVDPLPSGGTLTFTSGGVAIPGCTSGTLDSDGRGTCDRSFATAGDHPVVATYSGDAGHLASTSAPLIHRVSRASTRTTLTASSNPSLVDEATALVASVTPVPSGGTVSFTSNGDPIEGCSELALDPKGGATCNRHHTTAGDRVIIATYSGDDDYEGSASEPLTESVRRAPTETTLIRRARRIAVGSGSVFSASVSPIPESGTVSFSRWGRTIRGCALVPVDPSNGRARCRATFDTSGVKVIRARFSGNDRYEASISARMRQPVGPRRS